MKFLVLLFLTIGCFTAQADESLSEGIYYDTGANSEAEFELVNSLESFLAAEYEYGVCYAGEPTKALGKIFDKKNDIDVSDIYEESDHYLRTSSISYTDGRLELDYEVYTYNRDEDGSIQEEEVVDSEYLLIPECGVAEEEEEPVTVTDTGETWYIKSTGESVLSYVTDPEVDYPYINSFDLCFIGEVSDSELELRDLVGAGVLYNDEETALYIDSFSGDQTNSITVELSASKLADEGESPYYDVTLSSCKSEVAYGSKVYYVNELLKAVDDTGHELDVDNLCATHDVNADDFNIKDEAFNEALLDLDMNYSLEGIYSEDAVIFEIYYNDGDFVDGIRLAFCEESDQ